MKYTSTRDEGVNISSSEAIIKGISDEGGLFVPTQIPKVSNLYSWKDLSYKDIAYKVMSLYLTDFPEDILKDSIEKAYDDKFQSKDIAPVKSVGDLYFLELFHGPTLAFKDMALSILPYLLKEALKLNKVDKEVVILTATSGDTGKAALEGFAGVEGTKIVVFYPEDGVSEIQKLQMKTQEGENTKVVGINGNFDDAQSGVKDIFNDSDLKEELTKSGYILSSANSINIGRLIPQIVYYFYSYLNLLKREEINKDEYINISVPTGNFGDILAGYYAKKMGLPIDRLICASNENKVLTDFFTSKTYDKRRKLVLTSSPSMDILVSSNLERLIYHLKGEASLVKDSMKDLKDEGVFHIEKLDLNEFYGDYADEKDISSEIKSIYDNYDYLIDPHTAVASNVYKKFTEDEEDDRKTLIVSTASPFKFPGKVASSIGMDVSKEKVFSIIEDLSKKTRVDIPTVIEGLENKKIYHTENIEKDRMKESITNFLKVGDKCD